MQLRRETFDYLTRGAGFDASIVHDFFTNMLPATSYNFEYDQNDETPSYMSWYHLLTSHDPANRLLLVVSNCFPLSEK